MSNLPLIRKSPLATLKAITEYCQGAGTLGSIAETLNVDSQGFQEVVEWYLTNSQEPFSGKPPSPEFLLSIILLQLLRSGRQEITRLKKRMADLESKIRRQNLPHRV